MLQGTIIIPSCWKDPEPIGAERSFAVSDLLARPRISASVMDVSYFSVANAHLLMMR